MNTAVYVAVTLWLIDIVTISLWLRARKEVKRLKRQKKAQAYIFGAEVVRGGSAHIPDGTFDCSDLLEDHAEMWAHLSSSEREVKQALHDAPES